MNPTIQDVARLANVGRSTVSRVINNDATVHPAIRRAVEDAINALGYRPSPMARSLRSRRTNTLGFVLADLTSPSIVEAVPVAQELARARQHSLFIVDSRLDRETEREGVSALLDHRVDGIVWKPLFPVDPETAALLARTKVVALGPIPEHYPFPSIVLDLEVALGQLLRKLTALRHRRIGFAGLAGLASGTGFVHRVREMLDAEGMELVTDARWTFPSAAACRSSFGPWLRDHPARPTVVIVMTAVAAAALESIAEVGLDVPRDVSVVTFGQSELTRSYRPRIATLSIDYRSQAQLGIETLFDLLDGVEHEQRKLLLSSFEDGGSIGPASDGRLD